MPSDPVSASFASAPSATPVGLLRVAIVHDYLGQCGGAERVVLELATMFPDAPIFTSFYAPELTFPDFAHRDIRTSPLQDGVVPKRFRWSVLRYPAAFRSFDLSDFDTVVVSSSAFAHHIEHERSFVYCHTPPRFLYRWASYSNSRALTALAAPALAALRPADRRAASRHLSYAANSAATARRLYEAYGREAAQVIHPPLRTAHLPPEPTPLPTTHRALVLARLLPYKRIDVAVQACAMAGIDLTVVGEGRSKSRTGGGPGVEFVGRVGDDQLADLFREHSVVLVPGAEDFGYVPVEANYAGRPVVAFAAGGALETVVDGVSGRLVASHDPAKWAEVLRQVLEAPWSPRALRSATERFSTAAFRSAVARWICAPDSASALG